MTETRPDPSRRAVPVLAAALVAVVAPGTALVLAARDRLPDPLATHWGPGGVDGFTSVTASLWTSGALLAGLAVLFGGLAAAMAPAARPPLTGCGVGTLVGVGVLVYGSALQQVGLDDARDAAGPGPLLLVGTGAGLLTGLLAGRAVRPALPPLPADRRPVPAGAPVAWTGHATLPAAVLVPLLAVAVLPALALLWVDPLLGVVVVLVAALVLLTARARVTVDAAGLAVRSARLVTWLHVPVERVVAADTTTVSPFGDFGGWGLRVSADGRKGYVTRSGEALRVRRAGEPDVVVTVPGAAEAAAAMTALVELSTR